MAAGYDISASASSAISDQLNQAFYSPIIFGNSSDNGIGQEGKSGPATSVAARSLQGDVSAPQADGEGFSSPALALPSLASISSSTGFGGYILYGAIGVFALVALAILKKR